MHNTAPNRPITDSSNAIANTRFVQNNHPPVANLPLTSGQSKSALTQFYDTTGAASGTNQWLYIVDLDLNANYPDAGVETNIRYMDGFWPVGSTAWTYVRSVLKAFFSWDDATADARIATVQAYAETNR